MRSTGKYSRLVRAAALLLLLLTTGCVTAQSWEATRVLQDIDAGGGPSTLKEATPVPRRTTLRYSIEGRENVTDLYEPNQPVGGTLVLVPGFTRAGKNDTRVVELARSLARARFRVMVPEVPGSRALRVRLEDSTTIADALRHLRRERVEPPVGVVAISYAVGLAVLGALEVEADAAPDFLVGVGGKQSSPSPRKKWLIWPEGPSCGRCSTRCAHAISASIFFRLNS